MLPKVALSKINSIANKKRMLYSFLGVDIWPVFRNVVLRAACHEPAKENNRNYNRLGFFKSLSDWIYVISNGRSVDEIMLTSSKFIEVVDNKLYLKETEILARKCINDGGIPLILFQDTPPDIKIKGASILSVVFLTHMSAFLSLLFSKFDKFSSLRRYLCECLNETNLIFGLDLQAIKIIKNTYFVIVATYAFLFVLRIIKPKRCYIVCYYSCLGMAFCSACNKLGVEVSDIQHGTAGRNMRSYGQWPITNGVRYNTLPSNFMCWTKSDQAAIAEWATNCSPKKATVVTNNIWKKYYEKKFTNKYHGTLKKIRDRSKIIVLITLNSNHINSLFLELIKICDPDIFFLVRCHPDGTGEKTELLSLKNLLLALNPNVNVPEATSLPLFSVIHHADIHLTEWSATVYDAYFSGIKSITISGQGRDYFEDFIKNGSVYFCQSKEEIMSLIKGSIVDNN